MESKANVRKTRKATVTDITELLSPNEILEKPNGNVDTSKSSSTASKKNLTKKADKDRKIEKEKKLEKEKILKKSDSAEAVVDTEKVEEASKFEETKEVEASNLEETEKVGEIEILEEVEKVVADNFVEIEKMKDIEEEKEIEKEKPFDKAGTETSIRNPKRTKSTSNLKKSGITEKVIIQYLGNEYIKDEITKRVKNAWKDSGNKEEDITDLVVYIKPEDNAAYYVINGFPQGKIELTTE